MPTPQLPIEWNGLPLLFCPESYDHQPEEFATPECPHIDEEVSIAPDSGYLLLDSGDCKALPPNLCEEDRRSYWRLINEHNEVYNEILEANYDLLCEKLLDWLHRNDEEVDPDYNEPSW